MKCPTCSTFLVVPTKGQPSGELVTNIIGIKLKLIPAGKFLMGARNSEKGASDEEKPQHPVEISRPFYLGVYPVTQDEFKRVAGANPSHFTGDGRRPVENVTWFDAVTFCNHLSKQDNQKPYYKIERKTVSNIGGTGYRLPTEAEWEYACRAGTAAKWNFGDDESLLNQYAWYKGNSENQTHPIGELKPNPWGLYDMHGNVWEWCWDWYSEYQGFLRPADPTGPSSGERRVLRGGSFVNLSANLRATYRIGDPPNYGSDDYGFRVARTVE